LVGATKAITNIKTVARGTGVETAGTLREHRIGATVTITDFAHIKKLNDLLDGTTDLDADNPLKYDADPAITDDKELATKKYADDLAIAGSPKATDSIYGISKLSTPAVSPTEPIAVGDNDPRIPTIDEKVALAGTSGIPSSENKFVTDDDIRIRNAILTTRSRSNESDNALNVISQTLTLNDADHIVGDYAIYNYTTGNIAADGILTVGNNLINKILILKFSGDCTIDGKIDLAGKGGAGGALGEDGTSGIMTFPYSKGIKGSSEINNPGSGGLSTNFTPFDVWSGSGGGGGITKSYAGGVGGSGGGGIILLCSGVLSFTGTLDLSGKNGTNATNEYTYNFMLGNGGSGGGGGASGCGLFIAEKIANDIKKYTLLLNGGVGGSGTMAIGSSGGTTVSVSCASGAGGGASGNIAGNDGLNGGTDYMNISGDQGRGGNGANGSFYLLKSTTLGLYSFNF